MEERVTDILSKGDTQLDFRLLHWTINRANDKKKEEVYSSGFSRETELTGYAKIQKTRYILGMRSQNWEVCESP